MLSENDKQNLIRNLTRNRVILVTGAGFSFDAMSVTGKHLPVGSQLAQELWKHLYGTDYDGKTPLKTLYEAAKSHPKGLAGLRDFLRTHLHAVSIPPWFKLVTKWYWRRIYTFNADDLLEQLYEQAKFPQLDTIVAPAHYQERDAFLRTIQYIKLHGSINHDSDLTFGIREYGSRAAALDVWYLHFVEDYSTLPPSLLERS